MGQPYVFIQVPAPANIIGGKMYRILILWLLFLILPLTPASGSEASIVGSGCSVSVPGYLAEISKVYERETGIKVMVLGGGSVRGLTDLKEGRTDFAASCQAKSSADPEDFEFVTASWDALVFIVNRSNPVNSITPAEVRKIYEGRIDNWKQLGGHDKNLISVISTTVGMGGVGEALGKYILQGQVLKQQKNSTLQASSTTIWEQLVEEMPEAFASDGFGSARKRNVKMLKVNGVAPTKENIVSGKYPLRRPLYIVVKKNPKPEVRRFVEFILSKKGQKLISSYGMPSLSDLK
jgi:phosphate transport system substrate-binding protein